MLSDPADQGVRSEHPNLRRSVVTNQKDAKPGWGERWRERKRLKRERMGDSPEKLAERHAPGETAVDRMLSLGGIDRESGFKDK